MVSTRQSSSVSSSSARVTDPADMGSSSRRHHSQTQVLNVQSTSEPTSVRQLNLMDLPPEIFEKVASFLDYNTIAHLRLVCRRMNSSCGSILNWTFQRLQTQMLSRFQAIKTQMPRRESARRNHPLACESDIVETLHMRLTLLQMSFGKHIERKHCCFFPGEILDEVYRVLHYIKVTPKLAKPYKVTDELFDLSSMAMEYFKERIEPSLPEIAYFGADFLDLAGTFASTSNVSKPFICLDFTPPNGDNRKSNNSGVECSPQHEPPDEPDLVENNVLPQSNMVLRKRIRKIKQGMKRYNGQLTLMRRDLRNCRAKIADQQKQIVDYASRLDDNDKKNEETSRKFSTLLQELNKCKTELQYWRSKSPAIPICNGCGQSMPVSTDDFQALSNQGARPETFSESLNFIPITDGMDIQSGINSSQLLQQTAMKPLEMAPPKMTVSPVATKRKSSTDNDMLNTNDVKKPRRTAKSRQVKRQKI